MRSNRSAHRNFRRPARLASLLAAAGLAASLAAVLPAAAAVVQDLQAGRELAAARGQPLILEFTAKW